MAVIYSYPVKSTPELTDKMLISDGTDNLTKQVTISGVKDTIDVVDSITATVPLLASSSSGDSTISISGLTGYGSAGQVMVMNAGGTALEWSTITGGNGLTIFDDGSGIGLNIGKLDFIGNGVSAAVDNNDNTKVNITIPGGGGTPATPLNSVQFNNASAFGGSENFKYNNTNSTLTIGDNAVGNLPGVLELKAGPSATPSLKIQDLVNQNFVTIRTAEDTSNSYTIYLPDDGPGTGNKILQSDANGELSWINTPTGGGISFSGSTANGIATYSNSTTANVSSVFTVSGNKLSAPSGTLADPSIEVGAVGGLYAASGGILLAHSGANAIGVSSSSIINYKLTQFNSGLKFGSSGDTLESYEEGSWTPVMFGAGSPTVTATGQYVKIGRNVTVWFSLICTAGDQLANARISGLPFNGQGSSVHGHNGGVSISVNTGNSASVKYVTGTTGGATTLDLKIFTSGTDYQYSLGTWPNSQGNFTVRGTYTYKSQS